ncbi:Hypothetical protein A7982_03491 [Minicystis rosea]|nr:Hypothetical protein A7982_03491 [Minicystis rosea]
MRRALSYSIGALAAASAADVDRSDDDRTFFKAEKAKLETIAAALRDADRALTDFDLGPGTVQQAQVSLGDEVLDRGLRNGNTRTKLALRGTGGLDATHVFGARVDDLIRAPVAREPSLVLDAVARLDHLPDFAEKAAVKDDLTLRAKQQEGFLAVRDAGDAEETKLKSVVTKLVVDGALALSALRGALESRFPRQRVYQAKFFYEPPRRKQDDSDE